MTMASPTSCQTLGQFAHRDGADHERKYRHQRRIQRRAADAEQLHRAGEQINAAGAGEKALHDGLHEIFPKSGRHHVVEAKQQQRQAGERQDAGDGGRPHRRNPVAPQQHAEDRKRGAGRDEQQVAGNALRAHGAQRFDADDAKPEHDGQRAGDAAPRQSLLEHDPRQDQPADRGAGRLDDGAVAERDEHVAKIAPQRERQAAECGQQNAVPPADAAEIAQAAGRHEREQYEARPDEPVQRQNQRRQSDEDAVARGDKTESPEQGRAGAAQHA